MCVRNSESVANKRISIYQTRKISKEGKEEERDREKKKTTNIRVYHLGVGAIRHQKHRLCSAGAATARSDVFLIFSFWKPENSKGRKSIECTDSERQRERER